MTNMHQLQEAANFIGRALSLEKKPKATTAIVLGSGLGPFAKNLKLASSSSSVLFCDIPHFAPSTVEGHKGEVIYAMADDTPVIVVNGRLHFYEG
ncbi:MAG TPA: purine-nucleoside phosphorylase, partial [Myxococcota bacterium]|nr:purine-nucleoside phosphorylase [Myxococcota bacterium]